MELLILLSITLFQIEYVKDLTILPSVKDCDWNEDCRTIVREYFENPVYTLLSIYFEEDLLKARLNIPENGQNGFTYFLRTTWHVFTVDNFHATMIFGTVNRNVMMCVLKTMETMYVPVALNSSEWPDSIFFLKFKSIVLKSLKNTI